MVVTTVLVLVVAAITGSCCAAAFQHVGLKYSPSSFENAEYAKFLVPIENPNIHNDIDVVQPSDIRSSSNALAPHEVLLSDIIGPRYGRDGRNVDDNIPDELYDRMLYLTSQLMDSYLRYDSLYSGIRISYPRFGNPRNRLFNALRRREDLDHPALGPMKGHSRLDRTTETPYSPLPGPPRSGYQGLRFATELFPAFIGVHGSDRVSPFWAMLFYMSLLLFGIAQQLAVWRTLVEIVVSSAGLQKRRGLVTGCCGLMGLSAALPLATQLGPELLFFLDYVVGCGWWLMILQLVQVFAILFVRGKPVSAQDLVSSLGGTRFGGGAAPAGWSVHVTAFACSILVPVGLLVLSISSFKSGHYKEVFTWSSSGYWPVWASQLASGLQLLPILLVPVLALCQTCRFLANTRHDIFQRIQLLYRPPFTPRVNLPRPPTPPLSNRQNEDGSQSDPPYSSITPASSLPFSDPPPKYTPPPSYSTATGMGIAKALNQSFRRSIRHLRSSLRLSPENPATSQSPAQNTNNPTGTTNTNTTSVAETPAESPHTPVWTTQLEEPYIPPADYMADSSDSIATDTTVASSSSSSATSMQGTPDPPPIYATLDPLSRQRVLKGLKRAGIRGSVRSGLRESMRRMQAGRSKPADEGTLVAPAQDRQHSTTLELQGMDHLIYDPEIV